MQQSLTSLQGELSLINAIHDPYERFLQQQKFQRNLVPFDNSSKLLKKYKKFTNKILDAKRNMIQGAIMGFMVGGLFGLALGCYSAFHTKSLISIPISILVSGCSFGFILGCGSMIRSAEIYSPRDLNRMQEIQLKEGEWIHVYKCNQQAKASLI